MTLCEGKIKHSSSRMGEKMKECGLMDRLAPDMNTIDMIGAGGHHKYNPFSPQGLIR
jgi:hypothetical protein